MSIALNEKPVATSENSCSGTENPPIVLTEKAASEVKRIIADQQTSGEKVPEKIYLRMRVVGGGCSGFSHKLDLDPNVNAKLDDIFEMHGVPVVIDRRSLMYLNGTTVDFHDDLNKVATFQEGGLASFLSGGR